MSAHTIDETCFQAPAAVDAKPPRLLDQVAEAARKRGASEPTTGQLVCWVREFILFHAKRHPRELGLAAVSRFLEHVVRTQKQPLAALETARASLELLYEHVLGMDMGELRWCSCIRRCWKWNWESSMPCGRAGRSACR